MNQRLQHAAQFKEIIFSRDINLQMEELFSIGK